MSPLPQVLRRTRAATAHLPRHARVLLYALVVFVLSYLTAVGETVTIAAYPHYAFEDKAMMYKVRQRPLFLPFLPLVFPLHAYDFSMSHVLPSFFLPYPFYCKPLFVQTNVHAVPTLLPICYTLHR
jgi:hypothetical protein